MSTEQGPNLLYLLLCLMLVASSLIGMRLKLGQALKMALAWIAIFAGAFALFAFRGEFSALGSRLRAELTGAPIVAGREVRIPIGEDGHFWGHGSINGHAASFLIDSGASFTTLSRATADAAGIRGDGRQVMVETANGRVAVARGRAATLQLGSIERNDFAVAINRADDTDILGMNFLSSLSSWRVENNYLVLEP